jgi:hypothetical protein
MKLLPRSLMLFAVVLLLMTQRLPAPIQEVPERPTPVPASAQVRKSKKSSLKPKSASQTNVVAKSAVKEPTNAKTSRFAGNWVGTMQTFPAGNQTTVLAVDPAGTTMTVTWFGKETAAKAQLDGDTLRATFPPPPFQPQLHTWSLTPQPDGVTARVRFQCFLNDFTAVFHRSGSESSTAKTAR